MTKLDIKRDINRRLREARINADKSVPQIIEETRLNKTEVKKIFDSPYGWYFWNSTETIIGMAKNLQCLGQIGKILIEQGIIYPNSGLKNGGKNV